VSDHPRIEELRRRVQKDPASLAFAHLAEEYRRAGRYDEAIETCRAGLVHHPTYLSARVTLGRSLIEMGELDAAQSELQAVMTAAPDNLAAIRGLAEIHQRRGQLQEALDYYRWALEFAQQDPDLEKQIRDLRARVEPAAPARQAPPEAAVAPPLPVVDEALADATASAFSDAEPEAAIEPPASVDLDAPAEPHAADDEIRRQLDVHQRFLDAIAADRAKRQAGR
jgi:tetratricopeptide (TPR) repeat protein